MFSKACEYGIKAMIFISNKNEKTGRVGLKQIAEEIQSPEAFTAKILQKLSRTQLLNSVKGPKGGFSLNAPASEIMLADIIKAIDGDGIFTGCALGLKDCSEEQPCPVHYHFKSIRTDLSKMLHTTSLEQSYDQVISGQAVLKQ